MSFYKPGVTGSDKEAQTSPNPSSWGRLAARAGRPTYRSAARSMGTTASTLPCGTSLLFLELYQLLQYSYDCSSVMFVHPEGGGSARDTSVSLTSVV